MEDLSKAIDEVIAPKGAAKSIAEREKLIKKGGTQGTNGSILRRRVKPKPQVKNPR
ncbi:MAG: hypothetical protein F6J98_03090 [Moorea sp. SIO4G2]|uniref:hypothetical protein n=1 Tax=unclassified Moorena TaxID=2683338 RepID=UPI0013F6BA57|nr:MULTISPECIES: hypothetical protein [unclassified Moorena]NEO17042.1 hypothetical protein [Moorena sp. SIO3E8]NEO59438.1 hypothetical protein [Moorena sp. SIO4G2]NEP26973.1 hypothetical protein [Moorena sp. SIO3I6]NEQ03618.1 hypothetical protein [Moorena sp. SIO3F7]